MLSALVGVCLVAVVAGSEPSGEKTLVNKNVDFILDFMKRGMVLEKYWSLPLRDFQGDDYSAEGIALFNASTIHRVDDVFMYTPRVDDMTITGAFGLDQLWLDVRGASYSGKTFTGQLNAKGPNRASVRYTMYHKSKRNCRTQWELLEVSPFQEVTLSAPGTPEIDGEDVTGFVNDKLVPDLNAYFATESFLKAMSHDFNFCLPFP